MQISGIRYFLALCDERNFALLPNGLVSPNHHSLQQLSDLSERFTANFSNGGLPWPPHRWLWP
jgi:hypothetical protein